MAIVSNEAYATIRHLCSEAILESVSDTEGGIQHPKAIIKRVYRECRRRKLDVTEEDVERIYASI